MKMQNINFKVLEGVRGLAAFAVVLNHARGNLFVGGALTSRHFNHQPYGIGLFSQQCRFRASADLRSLCFLCCQVFAFLTQLRNIKQYLVFIFEG